MSGTLAGTIEGESNGTPESMFAVASVIYNRSQSGAFGSSDPNVLVNQPLQFTGSSANPSSTAQQFAAAVQNGTLNQYGSTGNALYFLTSGHNTTIGGGSNTIGGNDFSDQWGSPSASFQAPSYGGVGGTQVGGGTYYSQPPGYGTNFTAPGSTPDTFGQSVTPGSREQTTIPPGSYVQGSPDGTTQQGAPYEQGTDPVTGQPDWVLPDVNAGDPVTTGGAGSGGTTSGVGSGQGNTLGGGLGSAANPQGVIAQSGTGTPVQINLSPQTAADAQSWVTAPIKAAQAAASAWFASASNWFTRGFLFVLAAVILLVALWHVSGQPSPRQIVADLK